jgi:DNA-binding Lrp family transcriptional regulator
VTENTFECDELDQMIARQYVNSPKATEEEVATAIKRPYATVQHRIEKLKGAAILGKRTDITNWAALGYPFRYRIDVHVDQEALRKAPYFGAPFGVEPEKGKEINNWHRLADYIMNDLVSFVGRSPKTVTQNKLKSSDLVVQNVTILLGQQADLSVTLRAKNPDAILSFVVDGLRAMMGVRMTSTAHEAWSYTDGEL